MDFDFSRSYDWLDSTEEEKYAIWSAHIEAGGQDLSYPVFCDLLDNLYSGLTAGA